MKLLILILLVVAIAEGNVVQSYVAQCKGESAISEGTLKTFSDGKIPSGDQSAYKNFIFCLLKMMGFINAGGELRTDTDGLEKWLPAAEAKIAIKEVATLCSDQKGNTPQDTANLLYQCFLRNNL